MKFCKSQVEFYVTMTEPRPALVHMELPQHEVVPHAVEGLCKIIGAAIAQHGSALVGVTGSSSLHELYANLGRAKNVDWSKVVFFAVDDSFVPGCPTRGGATRKAIDGSFDWPAEPNMVFPGTTAAGVDECCRAYEDALENLLRVSARRLSRSVICPTLGMAKVFFFFALS